MYEFSIFANWSGSSLWRTRVLAVRPWLKAFIELVARPWGVFGPRDLAPLIRADSALVRFDISLETLFTAEARRRREKTRKTDSVLIRGQTGPSTRRKDGALGQSRLSPY